MPGYDLFVSEANAFPAFVVPTFFISREMNNSSVLLFSYSHFFKVEKRVVNISHEKIDLFWIVDMS